VIPSNDVYDLIRDLEAMFLYHLWLEQRLRRENRLGTNMIIMY